MSFKSVVYLLCHHWSIIKRGTLSPLYGIFYHTFFFFCIGTCHLSQFPAPLTIFLTIPCQLDLKSLELIFKINQDQQSVILGGNLSYNPPNSLESSPLYSSQSHSTVSLHMLLSVFSLIIPNLPL